MTDIELKVKQWCESKIGCGYIYGATGWVATQSHLDQQANQYPNQADTILNVGTKWIGTECYDCAMFVRRAAEQVGVKMVSGATSQWKKTDWEESGTIDTLPMDKVCFLYRDANGVKQHTGVYQGDGTVIDARGTKNGVIHTELNSYPWTHWAIPKWEEGEMKEMETLYQSRVVAVKGSTVNMRNIAGTNGKIIVKVPIGAIVDVCGNDGEWSYIKYDGYFGYMMNKFLTKLVSVEQNPQSDGFFVTSDGYETDDGEVTLEAQSGCELGINDLKEIYSLLARIEEILDNNTDAVG